MYVGSKPMARESKMADDSTELRQDPPIHHINKSRQKEREMFILLCDACGALFFKILQSTKLHHIN